MFKNKLQKGFTLIEMLIAMTIFVIFIGVLMESYISIVRSQREANEYRVMYSEARYIFDKFSDEVKNGGIYYKNIVGQNPLNSLILVSSDATRAVKFEYNDGNVEFVEAKTDADGKFAVSNSYNLNSDRVKIKKFNIYVSPLKDPYDSDNVDNNELQYQPKVTLFAEFEKEFTGGRVMSFDLQTTISSRNYAPAFDQDLPVFESAVIPIGNFTKINPRPNVRLSK